MNTVNIFAIDPGNTMSGWALIDASTRRPLRFGKTPNDHLIDQIRRYADHPDMPDHVAIEMIRSYGMAVGREVFETCVWIGRFAEAFRPAIPELTYRSEVKTHHCHSNKATDTNVRIALVDRFTPGARNYGKGTKANPGWFHGFADDIWQAYALAVLHADRLDTTGHAAGF